MKKNKIAEALLSIGAVSLRPHDPFTWSSGMKSPIYCDNRLTMSFPDVRKEIIAHFVAMIQANYPEAEVIAGTATAGIPHAAWVADRLDLPMIYVRSKAKGHGKENLIEGALTAGKNVVVIEDLISTGGSSIQAAKAVQEAGGKVLAVASIFTYELAQGKAQFAQSGIPSLSLTTYTELLKEAVALGVISEEDRLLLEKWRENPQEWSNRHTG
ncbi:orotate phosphoribosyltransferase [Evansella caseinilytica]|uniref:Orotate phosphoribosyltransferase n=1 Tax=Evansella caseinilytica TaxID=1503961 RepID=A0A1H3MEK6_9BACI|nr:orotate phosphoribosyltransferase [Evansella caseinilytica]SDY74758.1 orotate phosphoribosyltransferase [Evansella caseinilytica]